MLSAESVNPSILPQSLGSSPHASAGRAACVCGLTFVDLGIGEIGHWVFSKKKEGKGRRRRRGWKNEGRECGRGVECKYSQLATLVDPRTPSGKAERYLLGRLSGEQL